jgi:hypothetical protein
MSDTASSQEIEQIERRVATWLEEAIIGLNLCPFARPVYTKDQVRLAVAKQVSFDAVVMATLDEIDRLLSSSPDEIATTLVICPNALSDFDEFLDAVDVVEALLGEAGADGILQLAHFHPDYRFEGTEPDALENYTNRAPYPILHLLREAQVSEAVDSHPDPAAIPERNIERLEKLGHAGIARLWAKWNTGNHPK